MAKNRIFHLRKTAGLTQRELAELADTSQQQIQRVESGVIAVRLDLAKRIADALRVPIHEVFPGLRPPAKITRRKTEPVYDPEIAIDPDPRVWTTRFFMFDGRMFDFEVSSFDKRRLESIVTSSDKRFLCFDSREKFVAVSQTKIAACQFLFDPPSVKRRESDSDSYVLLLHLVSAQKPLSFEIEPDTKSLVDDDEGAASQLQRLFMDLDGADDDEIICFDDDDSERVYARKDELVLIEAPLECCRPSLFEKSMEGFEEEGLLDNEPTPRDDVESQ